jgi:hypothetical protein
MKWTGLRWLSENEKAEYYVIWSSLCGLLCKRRTTVTESLRTFCKGKGKGQPKTGHEDPEGE